MKHLLLLALLCLSGTSAIAQNLPILQTYGATLPMVLDTMAYYLHVADTGESGEAVNLENYDRFWSTRAVKNDSSGVNMFQQYYSGLHTAKPSLPVRTCLLFLQAIGQREPILPVGRKQKLLLSAGPSLFSNYNHLNT